ncbi:MAG: LVIVD repeat-containing protein [Acidimicrobiales bacterium]
MESDGLELIGHTDLDGRGDAMGLAYSEGYLYVGHQGHNGVATSVVDVHYPAAPRVARQIPKEEGTHSAKAAVAGGLLVVPCERDLVWQGPPFVTPVGGADRWNPGLRIYDLTEPAAPREVGFFPTPGTGVHRMTFTDPPYVFMSASDDGYTEQFLRIVDVSDPSNPKDAGRWWYPGMWEAGGERPRFPPDRRYALHHPLIDGDLLFAGWWDAGLVVLDVGDVARPQLVANLNWGPGRSGATHTALPLPGRDIVVVTDECIVPDCETDIEKHVRVVDVSDPYTPTVLSTLPVPAGDYCGRGGRFGPHNLAENRPHATFATDRVYVTYFNAGLRVYDLTDPTSPREMASFVPDPAPGQPVPQVDDVTIDPNGVIYVTDRAGGGVWILAPA